MYKFSDNNENDDIILHDCRATHISSDGNILTFEFEDGFWIGENNKQNPYGKILCTDKAEVKFTLPDEDILSNVTVYIFTEENSKTIREEWEFEEFIRKINNGMELEFLYPYKGYDSIIYKCWLWFDEEPYHKSCELIIYENEITYHWNNICENKTW